MGRILAEQAGSIGGGEVGNWVTQCRSMLWELETMNWSVEGPGPPVNLGALQPQLHDHPAQRWQQRRLGLASDADLGLSWAVIGECEREIITDFVYSVKGQYSRYDPVVIRTAVKLESSGY